MNKNLLLLFSAIIIGVALFSSHEGPMILRHKTTVHDTVTITHVHSIPLRVDTIIRYIRVNASTSKHPNILPLPVTANDILCEEDVKEAETPNEERAAWHGRGRHSSGYWSCYRDVNGQIRSTRID